jgi:hypothetical protein
MTDIYLFRHMFSLTSLGEGSEKRPTVTKHKMNVCARASKCFGAIFSRSVDWFGMANFRFRGFICQELSLSVILVDLAKDFGPSAFAFRQSFIKILAKFQQKDIGLGPTSQSSTPRYKYRPIHL